MSKLTWVRDGVNGNYEAGDYLLGKRTDGYFDVFHTAEGGKGRLNEKRMRLGPAKELAQLHADASPEERQDAKDKNAERAKMRDPSYVPTVDEALADPAGFVEGMTETRKVHGASGEMDWKEGVNPAVLLEINQSILDGGEGMLDAPTLDDEPSVPFGDGSASVQGHKRPEGENRSDPTVAAACSHNRGSASTTKPFDDVEFAPDPTLPSTWNFLGAAAAMIFSAALSAGYGLKGAAQRVYRAISDKGTRRKIRKEFHKRGHTDLAGLTAY